VTRLIPGGPKGDPGPPGPRGYKGEPGLGGRDGERVFAYFLFVQLYYIMSVSMAIVNLYSAESWSISTALSMFTNSHIISF